MISVAHNLFAMNASRQLNINTNIKQKSTEKLSSGYRINRSADDAAGLAISEKMRRQIRGLNQAAANTEEGISLCQVADGALNEVSDMLHRVTELSVKAANGTNTQQDREAIQAEISQIMQEIDRISENTSFNEKKIFAQGENAVRLPKHEMQDSFSVSLTSDYVNPGNYQLKISEADGVQLMAEAVGGNLWEYASFDWSEIVNESNPAVTLADADITAGTYLLDKAGMSLSFAIPEGSTKEDVIEALNGAEFTVNKDVLSYAPIRTTSTQVYETTAGASPGAEAFFTTGPYSMRADENGIWMQSQDGSITTSKVSWNSMGVTPDTVAGKKFTYNCPDTGFQVQFAADANATGEEVLDKINMTNVNYTFFSAAISGDAFDNWAEGSKASWQIGGFSLSENFVNSFNLTNVQKQSVGLTFDLTGTDYSDMKIEVTVRDSKGNVLSNVSPQYLEPDADTRAFLASNSFTQGTEKELKFTDGNGNWYSINLRVESDDCTANDIADATIVKAGLSSHYGIHGMYPRVTGGDVTHVNYDITGLQWENGADVILENKTTFWIHSGVEAGVGINVEIDAMSTGLLGIDKLDVTTVEGAEDAMSRMSNALQRVSRNRSKIGAQQNRLEHAVKNTLNVAENTTAAESQIRDTDMASEMMKFSQNNILTQAGQSVLAQANQYNQGVLSLLQ